jgi:hypothetical protein
MRSILLALILTASGGLFAQNTIQGIVTDSATGKPLPFVFVAIAGQPSGTQTDTTGRFVLSVPDTMQRISFSYLGYSTLELPAYRATDVRLKPQSKLLDAVIIRHVNPALELIRKAIEQKPANDPEKKQSFEYRAYMKSVVTADGALSDSTSKKNLKKYEDRLRKGEFFVNESYLRRTFVAPNLSHEVIEGTRTSGAQNTTLLASMGLLLQPFSFYADIITFKGRRVQEMAHFANPLSEAGLRLYDFYVADTILHGVGDTTFVVEFEPLAGQAFDGLKGVLHLHSTDYALEYVDATSLNQGSVLRIHLEQWYEKYEQGWFPARLESVWQLPDFKIGQTSLLYHITTIIEPPQIGELREKIDFGIKTQEIAPDATFQPEEYWLDKRSEPLSEREAATFNQYENLSPLRRFMTTASLKMAEWSIGGIIPVTKYLDLNAQSLLDGNLYEGFRPMLDLNTSPNFSKVFRFQGKIGYGTLDKAWKHELGIRLALNKVQSTTFSLNYRNSVSEPGNVGFFLWNTPQIPYELIRNFIFSRADRLVQYSSEFSFRPLKHGTVTLSWTDESRAPTYDYVFMDPSQEKISNTLCHISEFGAGFRWAYGEEFSQVGRGSIISKVPSPVFSIHLAQGLMDLFRGEFDYTKLNAKVEYTYKNARFGESYLTLSAGKIWGDLPYPYLYNGRGTKLGTFTPLIWTANHFNTMGLYEFTSDQYLNFFFTQNLQRRLIPTRSPWFRPEVSLTQGVALGSLRNPQNHKGIEIKTLGRGYFESGMLIDNLIRFKVSKLFYLGGGIGAFYRWGDNRLPTAQDNWTARIVWNVGL